MKGQAALEYLMTYGWAILIVIIIGVALYAMGVFNPGSFTGKKYTGLSTFTVLDWKASNNSANDTFTVKVSPRGHTISTSSENITLSYNGEPWTCTPEQNTMTPANSYEINCHTTDGQHWHKDDSYTGLTLSITYKDQQTNMYHTSTGTFSGKVE